MAELKTFLFTDIVGSVELKRQMPGQSDMERDQAFIERILTPHRERIERELATLGGRVVSTAGDGHFLVFTDTVAAARWAIGIQRAHRDEPIVTPRGRTVEVRISMHLGIPQIDPRDPANFVGKSVDYAARLSDYATAGQILASKSVVAVLEDAGMDGVSFHHHGRRDLRGIGRVEIWELVYDRTGPHPMRAQPREPWSRQWTVLPPTMGLTALAPSLPGEVPKPGGRAASARGSGEPGAPTTDVVPLRLGNYELEQRLGSGGMGEVYKARHIQFGRVRAVKVIKQHFVDSGHQEVIRRFYREIKAVGTLEHPNIVVAIDSSSPTDAVHYLVMEYIEGIGADGLVSRCGPLPVAEACEIARQAARGLAYIHQHGMVHRDIKPSNLMVTLVRKEDADLTRPGANEAVVKILDLGLALLVDDEQQRLTLFDNRAMGTAMYMSPEQWKTTSVDIRADIYSLGCTLYHLLAGKPPFWESDLKPEKAHEREKLPPLDGERAVPPGLWNVLERMMAKKPEDRYSSPTEVVAALTPFVEGHHLAELVEQAVGAKTRSATHGIGRADTLVANRAESETVARTPASRTRSKTLPPETRRRLWRAARVAVVVAAVAMIGWLSLTLWQRHWRQVRQGLLEVSANYAVSAILGEINDRFSALNELARDRELRERMLAVETATEEAQREQLRKELETWLGAERSNQASHLRAEAWFVNDRQGTQIARSPQSNKSTGRNYAHRDYFHGQGRDFEPGTTGLEPIDAPHLSAVYRSTTDGRLRVAFSVPVENGLSGEQRAVIGVLAMSVDLGDFDVLEKRLPEEYEVVLIDLREESIDEERRRGLVLHHQRRRALGEEQPPWVSEALLARIDQVLATVPTEAGNPAMLMDYRDEVVTGGRRYWGAMRRVINPRPERTLRDTGWVVLVQEPLER